MAGDGDFDCYVLVRSREPDVVYGFLAKYLPARQPEADEFEIPYGGSAPERLFHSVDEILAFLAAEPAQPHAIYWNSLGSGDPTRAMAFFTTDGGLILGLSVGDSEEGAQRVLASMKASLGSDAGTYWFESPAPQSAEQFLQDIDQVPAGSWRSPRSSGGRPMRCRADEAGASDGGSQLIPGVGQTRGGA